MLRGLAVAALMLGATPMWAQSIQILLGENQPIVRLLPPPWSTAEDISETSEVSQKEGKSPTGTDFRLFEMIPKGESFEAWTQLYAMTAENPLKDVFGGYVNGQVQNYANACTQAGVFHQQDISETIKVLIIMCAGYKKQPELGEVGFYRMELRDETMIKVYHHIRVPAFDITKVANEPPIPVEKMRDTLQRVGQAQVVRAGEGG